MTVSVLLPNMGKINAALHDWLVTVDVDLLEQKTYRVSPLEKAFNVLHRRFLATDSEYAFVLNADEMPPRGALEKLIEYDKDMVSCVAPKWDEHNGPLPVASRWSEDHGAFVYLNEPGLHRADRCGFSGILIKRAVMEAIPVGTFEYKPTAECECGWIDHRAAGIPVCPKCGKPTVVDGTYFISPEFRFEDVAREMGFELWVDFDLQMHHFVDGVDLKAINYQLMKMRDKTLSGVVERVRMLRDDGESDAEIVDALIAQGE